MKLQNNSSFLSIALSKSELWYIAQFFGPGWVFGIENPTEDLSEGEIAQLEAKVFGKLLEEGLIDSIGANQIKIDEMVGAMVYSCIHSSDLLVIKDLCKSNERFFHFLPQWQLELCKLGKSYELTLFKERGDLFNHLLYAYELKLKNHSSEEKFGIPARDLEMAVSLYESGKKDLAKEIWDSANGDLLPADQFINEYLKPESHIRFDILLNRDDEDRIHTHRNELLQTNHSTYWISFGQEGEQAIEMMYFSSVTPEQAEKRFNMMLPKN